MYENFSIHSYQALSWMHIYRKHQMENPTWVQGFDASGHKSKWTRQKEQTNLKELAVCTDFGDILFPSSTRIEWFFVVVQ